MSADFAALRWFIIWRPKCLKRSSKEQQVNKEKKIQDLIFYIYYCCDFPHILRALPQWESPTAKVYSAWGTRCSDQSCHWGLYATLNVHLKLYPSTQHWPDHTQQHERMHITRLKPFGWQPSIRFFLFPQFEIKAPRVNNFSQWFFFLVAVNMWKERVCLLLRCLCVALSINIQRRHSGAGLAFNWEWEPAECLINCEMSVALTQELVIWKSAPSCELLEKRIHGQRLRWWKWNKFFSMQLSVVQSAPAVVVVD